VCIQDSEAGQKASDFADTAAPGDCAVLIRTALLAGPVVKALNDHGIPFELTGGQCWWDEDPFKTFLTQVRESAAPEETFQKEKNNPALKRLFELAALFGNIPSLLDALACSGPGGVPSFNREGARIMTIHASKGLEFDHVFVIGLEDGILPFTLYDDAVDPPRLEEERRLLYVAMTRARFGLYLSWSHSRIFRGRKLSGSPSPFLGELEKIIPLAESKKSVKKDPQLKLF
jgi:superfamily I DNA/RNA helicase